MLEISGVNTTASKVVGVVHKIDVEEVQYAMNNMKNEKASRRYEVLLKKLKTVREPYLNSLTAIFHDISLGVSCRAIMDVEFVSTNFQRGERSLYSEFVLMNRIGRCLLCMKGFG